MEDRMDRKLSKLSGKRRLEVSVTQIRQSWLQWIMLHLAYALCSYNFQMKRSSDRRA